MAVVVVRVVLSVMRLNAFMRDEGGMFDLQALEETASAVSKPASHVDDLQLLLARETFSALTHTARSRGSAYSVCPLYVDDPMFYS